MNSSLHRFHIPVMGLGYTLDTPIKVAKYGINSVISIVQDDLIEKARGYYSRIYGLPYTPITKAKKDFRTKRITAYLNLVNDLVEKEFNHLKHSKEELEKYARMLPDSGTPEMLQDHPEWLKKGDIDVNIMTKLDRRSVLDETVLTDACSALKGYAESDLDSSLVLSAGLNPRLFAFMQDFKDFYPDKNGYIKKRIVVKVSDYRSALLQGKMLAKKGLWVSEYRVESGLNCGGHTFATEGLLLGPILEEFKQSREAMLEEQLNLCQAEWISRGNDLLKHPIQKISVQGGLGTSQERILMEDYFKMDMTGWGTPFLLVPEATSIDNETLNELIHAGEKDIYNSGISPLGIRFNTIRNNSGEQVKQSRINEGQPGSPCVRKHLAFDTTYHEMGMCTASATFQQRKIKELVAQNLSPEAYNKAFLEITEKECICDGLAISFLKKFDLMSKDNNEGVSICPGPNLAYFDRTYTLEEMVGHIYGKVQLVTMERPHFFIKELGLYIDFYKEIWEKFREEEPLNPKEAKRLQKFRDNMIDGIDYYLNLAESIPFTSKEKKKAFVTALKSGRNIVDSINTVDATEQLVNA